MKKLRVDVWSDIACPWCYVGKRRLESALRTFPERDHVEVVWRAFELDPSAPRERADGLTYAERLARKYGTSVPEAERMIMTMTEVAKADGLDFHFERIRPGNTFDAHRLLHLAAERGLQDAVKERFLRGYLTDGEPIGDPKTLVRLGSDAGLAAEAIGAVLAGSAHGEAVRADEEQATRLGITGVPFFVVGGRLAVSGAQSAAVLLRALEQGWRGATARTQAAGEGTACGPEGCG